MNKKISVLILSFIMIFALIGCNKNGEENKTTMTTKQNGKLNVIVSFNPLREFAEAIGKDKVSIKVIIPDGTEPHDFEPKAKDLEALSGGDVFIYNGLEMESWVDKTLEAVNNKNLVVVETAKQCDLIKVNVSEEEHSEGEHEHEHGAYDPHIWLSPKMAKIQCNNIKEAFIKMDPVNKNYYESNYKSFSDKLEKLSNEYTEKFKNVSNKSFVTGHAAFGYLCRDFGLVQNSVEDVFSEGEPTPKQMQKLVEFCKSNKVKTIFVEEMASPKVSETLARELNATTVNISTLECKEENKDYVQTMKESLDKVYESLNK